jgi:hypothetical protein
MQKILEFVFCQKNYRFRFKKKILVVSKMRIALCRFADYYGTTELIRFSLINLFKKN